MDNLFVLLMLISIVCLIWALIRPKIFQKIFKNNATRKNLSIYFLLSTIVCFILFGISSDLIDKQNQTNSIINKEVVVIDSEQNENELEAINKTVGIIDNGDINNEVENSDFMKYIKWLTPVDVYDSMEKQGFKTDKQLGGEYGNSWTSIKNDAGIEYRVEIYSSNINNVESIQGTVVIDVTQKEIIAAQQFFIFLSTLSYDGADQQKAVQRVKDNYNNDKATIVIWDVRFIIYKPSIAVRMLRIEKNIEKSTDELLKIDSTKSSSKITTKTGTYEQYTYTVIEEEDKKEKVATFKPFLLRDDSVLVGAIRKVTSQTFSNDDIQAVIPTTEERNWVNLILFSTPSSKYYFYLVKEDTGEVHSFSFWKE